MGERCKPVEKRKEAGIADPQTFLDSYSTHPYLPRLLIRYRRNLGLLHYAAA